MSAVDISRHLHQPEKGYSGLLRLQGRILLDSDENEREMLGMDMTDELATSVIGPSGASDDGYRITAVSSLAGGRFDLAFAAGSLYAGGKRFETTALASLLDQTDWLQFSANDRPTQPAADGSGPRHSFVYLQGWEQAVTSIEDSETLEIALNGADTSARLRPMERIQVVPTAADNCNDALTGLFPRTGVPEAFHLPTARLTGTTRLVVSFDNTGVTDDLCSPRASGGYLGADNESIRVQVVQPANGGPGQLIWSYQNAAPLYRVTVENYTDISGTSRRQVRMLTPPWDQISQPKAGDVVEILRWEALLPNMEKIAERVGRFHRVDQTYSATDGTLILEDPIPNSYHAWYTTPDGNAAKNPADDPQEYLFMRVWRGEVFNSGSHGLAFTPNTPVSLGTSGLCVTLNDVGRAGDFWIFSVRPGAPRTVVPWEFTSLSGAPPTGPIELIAPIGLLDWDALGENGQAPRIIDCRKRFRPLTRQSSCCEITVGDNVHSFGDVSTVAAALALLPAEGGNICVLKGIYEEKVSLTNVQNLTISGCGPLTRFVLPEDQSGPVFALSGCSGVTLKDFQLTALHDVGISILDAQEEAVPQPDIRLEKLILNARDTSAVLALGVGRFRMQGCTLSFAVVPSAISLIPAGFDPKELPQPGGLPGVVLEGVDAIVADCRFAGESTVIREMPHGGLHVRGGSVNVLIDRNVFTNISGAGVLLGSYTIGDPEDKDIWELPLSGIKPNYTSDPKVHGYTYQAMFGGQNMATYGLFEHFTWTDDGCFQFDPDPGGGGDEEEDPQQVPVAGPPVEGIRIHDNSFANTGLSAISVARFFDLNKHNEMIAVAGLDISRNSIAGAAQLEQPKLSGSLAVHSGFGGIALGLVEDAIIRGNSIHGAGSNNSDPYCGIYILKANGLAIERNRITENGRPATDGLLKLGQRGGIVIVMASAPQGESLSFSAPGKMAVGHSLTAEGLQGAPALRFTDNLIVQPEGRALEVLADGPVLINGNSFTSRGAVAQTQWLIAFRLRLFLSGLTNTSQLSASLVLLASFNSAGDLAEILHMILGGTTVSIINLAGSPKLIRAMLGFTRDSDILGSFDETSSAFGQQALRRFYRGDVLFSDNQCVFDSLDTNSEFALASVSVIAGDAATITDNQLKVEMVAGTEGLMANLGAISTTSLIVAHNTFREIAGTVRVSALTRAVPVTTVFNHASHPIAIEPPHPVELMTNKLIPPI